MFSRANRNKNKKNVSCRH